MALTRFGKALRDFRIARGEVLGHMARRMGMSTSELSGMENGRVEVPDDFIDRLNREYSLNTMQEVSLRMSLVTIEQLLKEESL